MAVYYIIECLTAIKLSLFTLLINTEKILNSEKIELRNYTMLFGIIIDKHLDWSEHIAEL